MRFDPRVLESENTDSLRLFAISIANRGIAGPGVTASLRVFASRWNDIRTRSGLAATLPKRLLLRASHAPDGVTHIIGHQ